MTPTSTQGQRAQKEDTEMTQTERTEALRTEAGQAGDSQMVVVCDRALAGDAVAQAVVDRVITDARAQED